MNNNKTLDAFSKIVMKQLKEAELEAAAAERKMQEAEIAMKMARKLVAERKMMKKKKGEQEEQRQQKQQQQRMQITALLQRNSKSISSLKTLAIKETRHEENCRAIPEGDEDEGNNDEDSIIVKSLATTSKTDLDENESESESDRNYCNCEIKKGDKQREERGQQQRVVLAKSVVIAMSA